MKELQKWFDKINVSLASVNDQVMQALPTVFSFFLILVLGFAISYILKKIVLKILQKSNLLLKKLSKPSEKRTPYLPEKAMRV